MAIVDSYDENRKVREAYRESMEGQADRMKIDLISEMTKFRNREKVEFNWMQAINDDVIVAPVGSLWRHTQYSKGGDALQNNLILDFLVCDPDSKRPD